MPKVVLLTLGLVAGVALTRLYAVVGERRWGVRAPDTVQMLAKDLGMVRLRAPDHRVRLPTGSSVRERLFHEGLYVLKWTGNFILITTIAVVLYGVMVALEIVDA